MLKKFPLQTSKVLTDGFCFHIINHPQYEYGIISEIIFISIRIN